MGKGDKDSASFERTWNSTTSSGYCSQEESDPELELFYTAKTSILPRRSPAKTQDEKPEKQPPTLSQKETEQTIRDYNSKIKSNLFMSMNKDGSYTGFIKVQLKLIRPVSVPAAKKPSCNHDRKGSARSQQVKRRTSFYLPKDASKHLHLSSRTPASEVIHALLRKFTVLDNPRKFALFQRTEKDGQGENCESYFLNFPFTYSRSDNATRHR
ncbi:hypothetical protein GDO78_022127 [Eleutherodactylus coqui]|uniref:Ras-associating domain-containing protein n=1 Tax=Eleutherodactylus coqui TaxID=57060 RepID=A0A8J6EGG8_ELECQ|nr:hypothetical protein GDO78_022127 [Eleutherodactylus coqui]